MPTSTVASQSGKAKPRLSDSWVVGVKVYGRSPRRLSVIRNKIREAKIVAHLWPPGLSGRRSCCVNCMINHPCRVISRFSSQRLEGAG